MSWSWDLTKLLNCKCFPCSLVNVLSSCCAVVRYPISQCSTTGGGYLALLVWQGNMKYAVQMMSSQLYLKASSAECGLNCKE